MAAYRHRRLFGKALVTQCNLLSDDSAGAAVRAANQILSRAAVKKYRARFPASGQFSPTSANDAFYMEQAGQFRPVPPGTRNVPDVAFPSFLRLEAFKSLLDWIKEASTVHLKRDSRGGEAAANELQVVCWATVHTGESSHARHTHDAADLSGVYYSQVPRGSGELRFHRSMPNEGEAVEGEESEDTHVGYPAQEGNLLVFPSSLVHSVQPFETSEDTRRNEGVTTNSDQYRVSFAFNVFFHDKSWSM